MANAVQQAVIKRFLAASKLAGKTKPIIDLQGNGGGSVYNGFDSLKQLFPTVEPFGGTRFRSTPFVDYISNAYSNSVTIKLYYEQIIKGLIFSLKSKKEEK